MNAFKETIRSTCVAAYETHKNNCSGFVNAVTTALGYPVSGTADNQLAQLTTSPDWEQINRTAAITAVIGGSLVVAGLRSSEHNPPRSHGHVVIVVDGNLYRNLYPAVWGGSIGNAQSNCTKSVGEVWNTLDRDNVQYFRAKGH
jgi:hypothetical protein